MLGEEKFGKSLVRYVHDLGLLDERMMVIHAIWIDDDDIALLARSGCTVAHNPVCNLRLGSGVMPLPRAARRRRADLPRHRRDEHRRLDQPLVRRQDRGAAAHAVRRRTTDQWPQAAEILHGR